MLTFSLQNLQVLSLHDLPYECPPISKEKDNAHLVWRKCRHQGDCDVHRKLAPLLFAIAIHKM